MPYGTIKIDTITFTDGGVDKSVLVSGLVQNPTFTGNITATGTISGNIIQGGTTVSGLTVTGTTANFASGVFTTQVSGVTVIATTGTFTSLTGTTTNGTTASFTTGNFTSLTGTTTTGTTANFASGVFTTQVSGVTVIATTGTFTSLTGTTTTGTTANFASGVFTTQVSGVTVIATTGTFTSLTGTTTNGTTASFTTGTFTSLTGTTTTGTTANFASGVFTTQVSGVTVIATTGTFTSLTGTTTTMTSGVFASGTAPLPSISFVSDPNTGIYSPGADQLAVATNGTEKLIVKSSGEIGIGTSVPNYQLHATTSFAVGAAGFNQQLSFTNDTIQSLILGTGYTPLKLNPLGGNVGIGTSSPGQNITVQSSASGTAPTFKLQNPVDSNSSEGAANNLSAGQLLFGATGSFPLTAKIESVYDASASFGRSAKLIISGANGAGTLTERVAIDVNGRVGIGTTGPSAILDVKVASDAKLLVQDGNTTGNVKLNAVNNAVSANVNLEISASNTQFFNGGSEKARIDSSGRLLVGTTSADGLISNISPVVAGAFKSHSGSVSIAPSTTVTIFTIPASNGEGAYTVTAIYVSSNNVTTFSAYAVILYDGSGTNAYRALGYDGSLLSITVSGRDVQLTTGATYTQGIKWSFVKQAVA